jgi:3-hydroxyisobutyrate dehydrogenase
VWIGLGIMGSRMAGRLAEAGHRVTGVVHRTAPPGLPPGVMLISSLDELPATAPDLVVTMLPGPPEVAETYLGPGGLLERVRPGLAMIDMTTSSPRLAADIAARAAAAGLDVLDAPVSGGPAAAGQGSLSIMAGGAPDALERVRPVLACLGRPITHQGPPGSGQLTKAINQILVAATSVAVGNAYSLGTEAGLDPRSLLSSLRAGAAGSPLLDFLWERLEAGDLTPGFKLEQLAKDIRIADHELAERQLSSDLLRAVLASVERAGTRYGGSAGSQASGLLSTDT